MMFMRLPCGYERRGLEMVREVIEYTAGGTVAAGHSFAVKKYILTL